MIRNRISATVSAVSAKLSAAGSFLMMIFVIPVFLWVQSILEAETFPIFTQTLVSRGSDAEQRGPQPNRHGLLRRSQLEPK